MSRTAGAFEKGKAFIPFITGGDPDLETTRQLLIAMEEAGADLIEIGIPFSDPIAEGVVIQEANERALARGATLDQLFAMVRDARRTVRIPLAFMTYMNPIYTYGKDRFLQNCVLSGIDALIIPDLPFEEKGEMDSYCQRYDIDLISMIAPTSKDRTRMIAQEAKGFLYVVSSLGVTGVRTEINTDIAQMTRMIREVTDVPCAIGFGISTPQQAADMAAVSDGAIVGSAIVRMIAENGPDSVPKVKEYVRQMKEAVRAV